MKIKSGRCRCGVPRTSKTCRLAYVKFVGEGLEPEQAVSLATFCSVCLRQELLRRRAAEVRS